MQDSPVEKGGLTGVPEMTKAAIQEAFSCERADRKRLLFEFNKCAMAQVMQAHGIASVTVSYSGEGDSGQIDEVDFEPEDPELDLQVQMACEQWEWDGQRHQASLVLRDMELAEAAILLCDVALQLCDHDGYDNNDGGRGTFTLHALGQADDGTLCVKADLEHVDYYTESTTSEHAL